MTHPLRTEFTAAPTLIGAHDSAWSSKIRLEDVIENPKQLRTAHGLLHAYSSSLHEPESRINQKPNMQLLVEQTCCPFILIRQLY